MKTILVTGGAGYIGSVAVKQLLENDFEVVVIDNLSNGNKELLDQKAKLYEFDLAKDDFNQVFEENKIDAVMHFAAYKMVDESMKHPNKYFDNIKGTVNLLNSMVKHDVKKIIFSSSAAVYGSSEGVVDEDAETNPTSYYGYTKLESEKELEWFHKIHGINYLSLRYFNVAGDGGLNYVAKDAKNVFEIMMEVIIGKRNEFMVFGEDYDSRDGTCIRDYIHILDLVSAHILALKSDFNGIINLGTSNGVSVKELINATKEVTGKDFKVVFGKKRSGDIGVSIASNKRAQKALIWSPIYNVKDMIKSMYDSYQTKI
jgi:UDP-glucose 4-epimerase